MAVKRDAGAKETPACLRGRQGALRKACARQPSPPPPVLRAAGNGARLRVGRV